MNKIEAIDFIENRPWQGSSLDLNRMKELMNVLHNPQKGLKYIHVAGTNGKGSTCAMLTSILLKAGYKVGTYTSPHLINYEERFCINNKAIDEKTFIKLVEKVKLASNKLSFQPRVFEILTAIGFLYFKKEKCDIVVLEVGMGGRLDATNIIDNSLVSVLMNIGLEHTEILGDTLEKIAREKAGIVKERGNVVCYDNTAEVINTFKDVCDKRNATLHITDFKKIKILKQSSDEQIFNYDGINNIHLKLLGKHQFANASVVIETIRRLNTIGYKITNKMIKDGLKETTWAGRLVVLNKEPLFILDGAHNLQCACALKESLPSILKKKKAIILCGMLKDKDYKSVMDLMIPFSKEFICVTPKSYRGLDSRVLTKLLIDKKVKATSCDSLHDGFKLALNKATKNDVILCFGSLYLAGEVLDNFVTWHKEYTREVFKEKREKISKKKSKELSNKIVKKIINSKKFKKATNILIYKAKDNEVDLSELTKIKGKIFAYPKCVDNKMMALIPKSDDDFDDGYCGIKEPIITKSRQMKKIDMVICPLVAFDDKLNRLGQGKGYYDRFLEDKNCVICGVGYELQKATELKISPFDKKMAVIYTESNIYRKSS